MEGADITEQFSKDTGVLCRQLGLKLLQQLLSAGLAIHAGLERQEVPQIHQQLIVFCRALDWGRCWLIILITLIPCLLW